MHHFHTKLPCQKPILRQTEWVVQNGLVTKNRVLSVNTSFFWKSCFSIRILYKELIWYTNYPNAHIHTFCKCWSFIWGHLFSVFLNNLYQGMLSANTYVNSFNHLSTVLKLQKNNSYKNFYKKILTNILLTCILISLFSFHFLFLFLQMP